jgi:ferredoxin
MYKQIIYCNCGGKLIEEKIKDEVEEMLKGIGIAIVKVSDLCGLCSVKKEAAINLFSSSEETLILACYPKAVTLLLKYAGVDNTEKLYFINLPESGMESLSGRISDCANDSARASSFLDLNCDPSWPAWFPLIDYSLCNSCGQCADFCIFGVFEKTHNKVFTVKPKACKNNCPACARICPKTAIVFPKYIQRGAIAGAETFDVTMEQERLRLDTEIILGNDMYTTLQQRKLKRRSIITEDAMKKSLEERDAYNKDTPKNINL